MKAKKSKSRRGRRPGRPSAYRSRFAAEAEQMTLAGLIDEQLAKVFGVTRRTITNWQRVHPAFAEAIAAGKARADAAVEQALFRRALGYSHPETHVSNYRGEITLTPITRHYPPDTAAAFIWLKNRKPGAWSDRNGEAPADPSEIARATHDMVLALLRVAPTPPAAAS